MLAARVCVGAFAASREPVLTAALDLQPVFRVVVSQTALVDRQCVVAPHAGAEGALLLRAGVADGPRACVVAGAARQYTHWQHGA